MNGSHSRSMPCDHHVFKSALCALFVPVLPGNATQYRTSLAMCVLRPRETADTGGQRAWARRSAKMSERFELLDITGDTGPADPAPFVLTLTPQYVARVLGKTPADSVHEIEKYADENRRPFAEPQREAQGRTADTKPCVRAMRRGFGHTRRDHARSCGQIDCVGADRSMLADFG